MILNYTIKNTDNYFNIKQVLKEEFQMSDRLVLKLKQNKQFFLNKKTTHISHTVVAGDLITVNLDFEEATDNIVPTKMKLNILYEDDSLLILNKPSRNSSAS